MNLFSKFLTSLTRYSVLKNIYLSSLVVLVLIFGDILSEQSTKVIQRALFDNATHAVIGGLSWLVVCVNLRSRIYLYSLLEVSLCTVTASFIDLDHFIAARSLSLKDATSLDRRPFLHCSSIPIILTAYLLFLSYYFSDCTLQKVALIIFTAFSTHHTRDATRRGYWIYPFGHTGPMPYFMYIGITIFIPYLVGAILKFMNLEKTVDYKTIDV